MDGVEISHLHLTLKSEDSECQERENTGSVGGDDRRLPEWSDLI